MDPSIRVLVGFSESPQDQKKKKRYSGPTVFLYGSIEQINVIEKRREKGRRKVVWDRWGCRVR